MKVWVTKDGRRFTPKEMDDQHLKNSIAKIERSANWRVRFLQALKQELASREVQHCAHVAAWYADPIPFDDRACPDYMVDNERMARCYEWWSTP
jgi:hypothetical protein